MFCNYNLKLFATIKTMHFFDSVRDGFRAVNRNWQLVLVRIAASFVNLVAFFLLVGVPVAAAIILVGIEFATSDPESFLRSFRSALSGGYLGLVALILASFILYFTFAALLLVYVMAGTAGVLGGAVRDPAEHFSAKDFFFWARRLFSPILWLYSFVGLFMLLAGLVIGLAVGGAAFLAYSLQGMAAILAFLFGAVFVTALFLCGVLALVACLAAGAYGAAFIVFEGERPWASLRKAAAFLKQNPKAFWGYALMILCYAAISFVFFAAGYPFKLIPIIGLIVALPYQLLVYAAERYLGLAITATVFSYFAKARGIGTPAEARAPSESPPPPPPSEEEVGQEPPRTTP
jgi:hypothetical protein